jgi:hypothetical protein
MPTSLCTLRVVWFLVMSMAARQMPFQQAEEHTRKKGSTTSSLDLAPSPTGPTSASGAISTPSTEIGPDWLPRMPRPSQLAGSAWIWSLVTRKQDRLE